MKKKLSHIFLIVFYIILLAILIVASISAQRLLEIESITLDSTWDLIKNAVNNSPLFIVAGIILALVLLGIKLKEDIQAILFTPTLCILVVFYEINSEYTISKVLVGLVGLLSWVICLVLLFHFMRKAHRVFEGEQGFLKSALKHVWGRHDWLISVQAYQVNETHNGSSYIYNFSEIDHYTKSTSDINAVLSMSYKVSETYIESFKAIINFYQAFRYPNETEQQRNPPDEANINVLLQLINTEKNKIQDELSSISCIEEVSKEACCLARMLNIYQSFLKVLDSQENGNSFNGSVLGELAFKDGDLLGADKTEIEKALFTAYRTGLLCGILLGNTSRYHFEYRKDGGKQGRRYYVSAIYPRNNSEPIVCLFICSEKNNQRGVYEGIIADLEQCITNYLAN